MSSSHDLVGWHLFCLEVCLLKLNGIRRFTEDYSLCFELLRDFFSYIDRDFHKLCSDITYDWLGRHKLSQGLK